MTFKADLELQAAAQHDAANAIKFAWDHFKIKLDWSDQSIKDVELILEKLHKQAIKDKPTEEQIFSFARPLGSYIGEVFRRNHGAEWGIVEVSDECYPGLRCKTKDLSFWPWVKAHNRLINGEEDNVWDYYQLLRNKVTSSS